MLLCATSAGWHSLAAGNLEQSNALSCEGSATYIISNYQGNLISAQPTSTSGFQFSNFSYNPGLGTLTFNGITYSNYRGFGTFEVEINIGGDIVIVAGKVAKCCQAIAYDQLFINEEITPQTYSGQTILLFGDIRIPAFTEVNNSTVLLGVDAQVILESSTLHSNSSTFDKYCDFAWDQVVLDQTNESLLLSSSIMRESIRGVHTLNNAEVNLESSTFQNNVVSVYVENHSGSGPFLNSYLRMDGCTIDFTRDMNPFTIHPDSPIDPNDFFPTSCSGININDQLKAIPVYVGNSDHVNIGHDTYQQNKILMSTEKNQNIFGIAVDAAQVFIKNNFVEWKFHVSVCSDNQSKVNIGGDAAAEGNVLESGFELKNSSFFVGNNTVGSTAISGLKNPWIANVQYISPANGRRLGGEIVNNTFQAPNARARSLFVNHNGTGSYLRIYENDFNQHQVEITNFNASSSAGRLVIHSNYMEILDVVDAVGYKLEYVNGSTFANNEVRGPTNENTIANDDDITGVYWESGANSEFYGNDIKNWNYGLRILNSNQNTQFECNTFTNNYFGIYLDYANISDQGSSSMASGNKFIELFSPGNSNPYSWRLTGTASQPVLSTWYQHPTSLQCANFSGGSAPPECLTNNFLGHVFASGGISSNLCNTSPISFKNGTNTSKDTVFENSQVLSLFPNPSTGKVVIRILKNRDGKLNIYNHVGELFYMKGNFNKKEITITTELWPAGVYLVRYGNEIQKLIVK